jgi:hypothetical protein
LLTNAILISAPVKGAARLPLLARNGPTGPVS